MVKTVVSASRFTQRRIDPRESRARVMPDDLGDLTVTRDLASYDWDGSAVAVDSHRRTKTITYWPRIKWQDFRTIEGDFLAAGCDHDNKTPIIFTYDSASTRLRCYAGETLDEVTNVVTSGDLMLATVAGEKYRVRSIVVHCGLVVAMAERQVSTVPVGLGLLYSTDRGATWTRIQDVGGDPYVPVIAGDVSSGMSRGQPWSMSAAFPVEEGSDLTNVFVPWADYIFKVDNPKGGQAGLFRAYRTSETSSTWTIEDTRTFIEVWESGDSGGMHCHTSFINSLGFGVHVGDVAYRNTIRQAEVDLSDYQNATITTTEIIFGGFSTSSGVFNIAPQPVAAVPGPTFGSHIASSDESHEVVQIFGDRTNSGDDLGIDAPIFSNQETGIGTLLKGFALLNMQYVYGGGWASVGAYLNDQKMACLSRDGTNWGCVNRPENGGRYIIPMPNYLLCVQNDGLVSKAPWPERTTAKAIDIKCGGVLNKTQIGSVPTIAQATAPLGTSLSQYVVWDGSDYVFYSGGSPVPENDELKSAGPPPFGYSFTGIRHVGGDNRTLARTWLHNAGNTSTFDLNTAGKVHVMSWLFLPASQRQGVWHTKKYGTDGGSTSQGTERGISTSVTNQFVPHPFWFDQENLETDRPWVIDFCPGDASGLSDGLVHYTWVTHVGNGIYGISYPYDRNFTTSPPQDTVWTVESGSDKYTINLTLYVPRDIFWTDSRNPIATFWQDANNYVELKLQYNNFEATATVGGVTGSAVSTTPIIWRDQCCDIALTKDSSNNLKMLGAFPSMEAIQELDLGTADIVPTEVRFSNADKSAYQPIACLSGHYVAGDKDAAGYGLFVGRGLNNR